MTAPSAPAHHAPARGYSWPPFEKGNQAARTHGLTGLLRGDNPKPAQLEAIEAIYAGYLEEFPFLHDADLFELRHLSRLRYMIEQLSDYGDRVCAGESRMRLPRGTPTTGIEAWYASSLVEILSKLIVNASALSANLGLNPAGRAAIVRDAGLVAGADRSPDSARITTPLSTPGEVVERSHGPAGRCPSAPSGRAREHRVAPPTPIPSPRRSPRRPTRR